MHSELLSGREIQPMNIAELLVTRHQAADGKTIKSDYINRT